MKIVAFVGPSGYHLKKLYSNIDFRPPARYGDLFEENIREFDIIIFADSCFFTAPAPTHYEILKVLERKQTLIGVSSSGALRASELFRFGMIGFGNIYNNILSGNIKDDSDLGVLIHPATFESLTISLANLRYFFLMVAQTDRIDDDKIVKALRIASEIYFMDRTINKLLRAWEFLGVEFVIKIKKLIKEVAFDLKCNDFKLLLDLISMDKFNLDDVKKNNTFEKIILPVFN